MTHDAPTRLRRIVVPQAVAFTGYPSGVVVEGLLFLSGQRALEGVGRARGFEGLPADARLGAQGFWLGEADEEPVVVDAWSAHDALDRVLAAAGSTVGDLLRLRIWQRDKRFFPAYERVRAVRQPRPTPSSGHAGDPGLGVAGRNIGLDGVAIVHDPGADLRADRIGSAGDDPTPTHNPVVAGHGQLAFMAGLTPVRQEPGFPLVRSFDDLPEAGRRFATGRSHTDSRDGPIAAQTWFVYDKVRSHLQRIGGDLHHVAHCLVSLHDLRDMAMFHRVHRDVFGPQGPALTVVGAAEVGHRGSRIYVEPTIFLGESPSIEWPEPPPLSAPLARRVGNLIMLSGTLPVGERRDVVGAIGDLGAACPSIVRTMAAWGEEAFVVQCWRTWVNLAAALERSDSSLELLVKLTVFIAHRAHWPVFEAVRACFLGAGLPAIEAIVVPHPGPNAAILVQIDAVAAAA